MKILLLTLLLSFNTFAATGIPSGGGTSLAGTNTITVAGRTINLSDSNVKIGISSHNVTDSWNTMQTASSTAPYLFEQAAVPTGKKWTVLAVSASAAAADNFGMGYSDNTQLDVNGTITNGVRGCNSTATTDAQKPFFIHTDANSNPLNEYICHMVVPAGKYIYTKHATISGGTVITIYYLEEDAT